MRIAVGFADSLTSRPFFPTLAGMDGTEFQNPTGGRTPEASPREPRGLLRNVFTVGSWTALSRVLGFVREMLQSRLIGAGMEQSAFTYAFLIPNLARRLFGEGVLTSAFVPVFKEEIAAGRLDEARRLARAISTMVALMLGAVVLAAMLAITAALGLGDKVFGERTGLILRLTRITLPYAVFICAAAFGMGVLNALGRFLESAFAPCILNLVWIGTLGVFVFVPGVEVRTRLYALCVAIVVAGALQMAFMLWALRRRGFSLRPSRIGWHDEATRLVWRNTLVAAVGAGAIQLNAFVDQSLAQIASPWASGVIGFADRLMELPLAVVGIAFGTVLLPAFSDFFARGDEAGARDALVDATHKMLFVMVPASVGLAVLAPDVVRVVYEGGRFDAEATVRVSRALRCYAAGLAVFGFNKAIVPWFHAQKDLRTPLLVSVRMVLANLALNAAAAYGLPIEWRHVGIAFATVATSIGTCAWLLVLARRRSGGALGFRAIRGDMLRMLLASAVMAAALVGSRSGMDHWLTGHGLAAWVVSVLLTGLCALVGAIVYAAVFGGLTLATRNGRRAG